MKALVAFVLASQTLGSDSRPQIAWDTSNGSIRTKCIIGEIEPARLQEEALRVLAPSSVRVGRFVAYRSIADKLRGEGQGNTDCSYESWRNALQHRELMARPVRCPEIVEVLKIGEDIVFRTVDRECRSRKVVLQGQLDPLGLQLSGVSYEVLTVTVQPLSRTQIETNDMFSPVHFFVRTDSEVTIERAREVLSWVRATTAAPDIAVLLRNDASFAMHCDFPLVLPFVTLPVSIPTKAEFLRTKEVYCGKLAAWPVQCY